MNTQTQEVILIGMDLHSEKVAICKTRWVFGREPKVMESFETTLDALEKTYKKRIPQGSLTIIEATGNAFETADRIERYGQHTVKVVNSDAVSSHARSDRVTDKIDAKNLAFAYARGGTREVFRPSTKYRMYRDLFYGYTSANKDVVRNSNRIWSFCHEHGFAFSKNKFEGKIKFVREQAIQRGWSEDEMYHLDRLLDRYHNACLDKTHYLRRIYETVMKNSDMIKLMQILGIRFLTAFGLVTFIEDVHRFEDSKNLTSYFGFNLKVSDSGKKESKRKISNYGNRKIKSMVVECAQAALIHGKAPMHKWARRKIWQGKHRNEMAVALARKMLCFAWHILMGHPVPMEEPENSFKLKLRKLYSCLGKDYMKALGYKNSIEYANSVCAELYPPKENEELQTGSTAIA